jgi:hypothetical protein
MRISVATSLSAIRAEVLACKRCLNEVIADGRADGLIASLDAMEEICVGRVLLIEVHAESEQAIEREFAPAESHGFLPLEGGNALARLLMNQRVLRCELHGRMVILIGVIDGQSSPRVIGRVPAPLIVRSIVLPTAESGSSSALKSSLEALWREDAEAKSAPQGHPLVEGDSWVVGLERFLGSPEQESLLDARIAIHVASALEQVVNTMGLALEQEVKATRVRRGLAQTRVSESQGQGVAGVMEILQELRTHVQTQQTEFARGIRSGIDSRYAAGIGSLWDQLDEQLKGIDALEETKKVKHKVLTLHPDDQERVFGWFRRQVERELHGDILMLNDHLRLLAHWIETQCEHKQMVAPSMSVVPLDDAPVARMLDISMGAGKPYRSEVARMNGFQRIMDVRRLQMLVFMLCSSFGLSFIRSKPEIAVPLSVILIGIGVVMVVRQSKNEASDARETELEKAREWVRGEVKRVLNDVQRSWLGVLEGHAQSQVATLLAQVESSLKAQSARRAEDDAALKERVQRQIQLVESVDRQIQNAQRTRDGLLRTVSQHMSDLRAILSGPTTRPLPGRRV